MSATRDEPAPRLRIQDAEGGVLEVPLVPGQRLQLGRSDEVEVRLDGPGVSRVHAEVVREGGRWVLVDAGSRNGIHTDAGPVERAALDPSRPVALAGFLLRLAPADPGPGAAAPPEHPDEVTLTRNPTPSGRVGAEQLAALRDLAERLRAAEPAGARLAALVAALVEPGFGAWHAGVLGPGDDRVEAAASSPAAPGPWRLSRSALAAARDPAGAGPVLATPAGRAAGAHASGSVSGVAVEQSMVETPAEATGALVLPLRVDGHAEPAGTTRLLYVVLPAARASADWLALGVLVADAWAAAEAGWSRQADAVAAARLRQDLDRARTVQRGLLPASLALDDRVDAASHYRACHGVGGDHLDALLMPDGRLLFLVADVCGKGVQAALVSAGVRTFVRAVVPTGPTLLGLVEALNAHLVEALPASSFVTAVFAAFDPATGACELVHAGHPPALVLDAAGVGATAVGDADADGFPLGVLDDAELVLVATRLPAGGRLLLYSDGLSELKKDGRWLGTAGLVTLLEAAAAEAADGGCEEAAAALVRGLDALAGEGPADDDQAFVLVRRAG